MNIEKLNQWLSLVANFGVLIGIVFLSFEISQSNRIAVREARNSLMATRAEITMTVWESEEVAEFMIKLRSTEFELTPTEKHRALNYAMLQINQAISVEIDYEGGFLTDKILARNASGMRAEIRNMPGLLPYLKQAIEEMGMTNVVFGPDGPLILREIGVELMEMEQDNEGSM